MIPAPNAVSIAIADISVMRDRKVNEARMPGPQKIGDAYRNIFHEHHSRSLVIIGMIVSRSASGVIAPICLCAMRPSRSITNVSGTP